MKQVAAYPLFKGATRVAMLAGVPMMPLMIMFIVVASVAMLFGLLGSYFAQVRKSAQRSFVDEVRAFARATLPTGKCTIDYCAARMEASPRTIQRRLTDLGFRFSEIVEEQRIDASRRALTDTDDPLSDIAFNLGYSDQSSFGRAFKRWTGMTPQAYRERRGSAPAIQ